MPPSPEDPHLQSQTHTHGHDYAWARNRKSAVAHAFTAVRRIKPSILTNQPKKNTGGPTSAAEKSTTTTAHSDPFIMLTGLVTYRPSPSAPGSS